MKVVVGADHGGFRLKAELVALLEKGGHEVIDLGVHDEQGVDYPDIANAVVDRLVAGDADRALLVCGTGQGMAMAANKRPGVRAAVVSDTFSAKMAMEHNDARVLCLGQRVLGAGLAGECLQAWLNARFEGGRHERRVAKIEGAR